MFKGKLPWPYYHKMAMILLDTPYVQVTDLHTTRRLTDLVGHDGAVISAVETELFELESGVTRGEELLAPATTVNETRPQSSATNGSTSTNPTTAQKRAREGENKPLAPKRSNPAVERTAQPQEELRFERYESLAKSVEQCSGAAAGMARGFQELVSVFQDQAEKCRRAEASGELEDVVRGQHHVLLSIAKSLEQSTQATADMAKGYHKLVQHYIQESDARRATL